METIARLLALVVLIAVAAPLRADPPLAETPTARERARACLEQNGRDGVTTCQQALALGLAPERAMLVQGRLVLQLEALAEWDEAVVALQDLVLLRPDDAEGHLRLGEALLHFLGRAEEAEVPIQEALRLEPENVRALVSLGLAHHALARHAEAASAFTEALRLDGTALEARPAAQAAYEASQRGEAWPPR